MSNDDFLILLFFINSIWFFYKSLLVYIKWAHRFLFQSMSYNSSLLLCILMVRLIQIGSVSESPFKLLWALTWLLHYLSTCLWDAPGSSPSIPAPALEFLYYKEAVSFDVENDNWNPNLGINCVVILDITVLGPFRQLARKQYMWRCACIFICINFCIYILKTELILIFHFLFSTTGFFLALPFLYNLQWEIGVQLSLIYYLFN